MLNMLGSIKLGFLGLFGTMADFISGLTGETGINQNTLWGAITPAAGVVGLVVIFALSYRVLRRLVKGVSKGKANF